ncbi:MAG: hypothetical protein CR988_06650 [Treponema sp.]|nr:MAG: hypothetical protein CR988_06650 [Treponema sp.]
MKKFFRFFSLFLIAGLLFSCAGKKSELIKAHKTAVEKSVKANYAYMRELGFRDFADNGSVETNIVFENIGSILSGTAGKDMSSFDGLGLNFYSNNFGKKFENEVEIALTKESNSVSLLNLKLLDSKIIMALPFTKDNKTFFATIKELNEKFGDSLGKEMDLEQMYKVIAHTVTNPVTEKEYMDFVNKLIDDYFNEIDVKKEGEFYVYTVSKEQSKKILRAGYDETMEFLKKTNPVYSMNNVMESYDEVIKGIEESDGFSYSVKQKVDKKVVTYTEINFEIEGLNEPRLIMDYSQNDSQNITAVFVGADGGFDLKYNAKKNGDDYAGEGFFNIIKNDINETTVAISVKNNKEKFTCAFQGGESAGDLPIEFVLDTEKGKPENKFSILMNTADVYTMVVDGVYAKTAKQVNINCDMGLESAEMPFDIIMATKININKDKTKTLEFAKDSEQLNLAEMEKADMNNTGMQLVMDLASALMSIGIDMQQFMGGGI